VRASVMASLTNVDTRVSFALLLPSRLEPTDSHTL
jgi:hypothetical protein